MNESKEPSEDESEERTEEDMIKEEERQYIEHVKANAYPSYKAMAKAIVPHLELYADYGEINHELCKLIYENMLDMHIVHKAAKKIYGRGGLQALQANYTVLKYFSPIKGHMPSMGILRCLEFHFDKWFEDWHA